MGEEDWVEYSQNQLQIRQELTDASRQRRPPDPNIVPVTPKTPAKQAPRVAVAVKETSDSTDADGDVNMATEENVVLGPTMVKQEEKKESKDGDTEKMDTVGDVGGGAWGAGAAPGSMLAKLIEEQERKNEEEEEAAAAAAAAAAAGQQQQEPDRYSNRGGGGDYYGSEASGGGVGEVVAVVTSIMVVEENNSLQIKPLRFAADEDEVDLEDHLRTFLIITRLLHGLGAEVEGVAFEEDTMMVMAVVIEDKLPAASFSEKIILFYNNLLET